MKIASSDTALSSRHEHIASRQVQERLHVWVGDRPGAAPPGLVGAPASGTPSPSVLLHLSDLARAARPEEVPGQALGRPAHDAGEAPAVEADPSGIETGDTRMMVLARMVEALTGIRVRVLRAQDLVQTPAGTSAALPTPPAPTANPAPQREGWGLEYDRVTIRHERETTAFAAQGTIRTTDGRTIHFSLAMLMQREHLERSQVSVRAGDAVLKDPLVLHFDGALPSLTDTRFAFDLDADGQQEQMPFVGSGSGFLVLDLNDNGRIDDGRELFGALSGNGFADLARHDGDGNGWIDAADAVFHRLQVWQKDAAGQDSLRGLAELGVGALYLGRVDTPFALRDAGNATLGQVRASGLYLNESGQAGLMQQIDLAV